MDEINRAAFLNACYLIASHDHIRDGIGTYNEKSMHLILKTYFESNCEFHEVPYKGYIADIKRNDEIIEIQTSSLSGMNDKLGVFLEEAKVRIVIPVNISKNIIWVDPKNGDISAKRKSPKKQSIYSILPQMIYISDYLCCSSLCITFVFISSDEYRILNGWDKTGRKGAEKHDTIPTDIFGIHDFRKREDYFAFVPEDIKKNFSRNDYSRSTGLSGRDLWAALKVLEKIDVIKRASSSGRAHMYSRSFGYDAK